MLPCRARATEAVGIIACAVGKDAMGGSIPDFVGVALQVWQLFTYSPHVHIMSTLSGVLFTYDCTSVVGMHRAWRWTTVS